MKVAIAKLAAVSLLLGGLTFGQVPSARVRVYRANPNAPVGQRIFQEFVDGTQTKVAENPDQGRRSERQPRWWSQLYRCSRRICRDENTRSSPSSTPGHLAAAHGFRLHPGFPRPRS
jgi:hypothetical protein